MLLLTCATAREAAPLKALLPREFCRHILITGIGPVETTLALTRHLSRPNERYQGILQFGIAGAYTGTGIAVGDLCLADAEVFGDFGICEGDSVRPLLVTSSPTAIRFDLESPLFDTAQAALETARLPYHTGCFVTVNSVSGNELRGTILRDTHNAICENMEGSAAARVALAFGLPCLELRGVSNMVEKRNPRRWRIDKAATRCAEAVQAVMQAYYPAAFSKGIYS